MKGLLLKDVYTLIKQMKLFLLMIVLFSCMPGYSVSSFVVVYSAMLPISALAYDERCKWDIYAAMMPYTTRSLVVSKYLLGYVMIFLTGTLSLLATAVLAAVKKTAVDSADVGTTLAVMCVAVIFQAINLPFMFRLGVEKGRIAFYLLMILAVAGTVVFSGLVDGLLTAAGSFALVGGMVAVALIANLASVWLSLRFYQKRFA